MGSFANTLFMIMLGWLQGIVSAVWSGFTTENGRSFFSWIGSHWILITVILCSIGLCADLAVYLFRWKPFSRKKEELYTKPDPDTVMPGNPERAEAKQAVRKPVREQMTDDTPEPAYTPAAQTDADQPDLSRWIPEPKPAETGIEPEPDEPATITNAGYVVPADSPYRRPAYTVQETPGISATEKEETYSNPEEKRTAPLAVKRRRRISVSELFSDPEEELKLFDAPQQLIDSRKAYREPVYPSGWKKGEENRQ